MRQQLSSYATENEQVVVKIDIGNEAITCCNNKSQILQPLIIDFMQLDTAPWREKITQQIEETDNGQQTAVYNI